MHWAGLQIKESQMQVCQSSEAREIKIDLRA